MRDSDKERIAVGCVYGQYSSLEPFSLDVVRYVGMTGTANPKSDCQKIADDRLKWHLREDPETTCNPEKVAWYAEVMAAGGHILCAILDEVANSTRTALGELEHQWIVKLGGPMVGVEIVQLFNKTWGKDGGWCVEHDEAWKDTARQRMMERYATPASRTAHGGRMRQVYRDDPTIQKRMSAIQLDVQNRPDRLENNRQSGVALWQDPAYRVKQAAAVRPCPHCGKRCKSPRGQGRHNSRCLLNPQREQAVACIHGCGKPILPSKMSQHWLRGCAANPEVQRRPYGQRPTVTCEMCGQTCGEGAGLSAHIRGKHTP